MFEWTRHVSLGIAAGILVSYFLFPMPALAEELKRNGSVGTEAISSDVAPVNGTASKAPAAVKVLLGGQEEIKKIDQKKVDAKEGIKKEIEAVEAVKKEVEKVVDEKKILDKDAKLKEQAASIAKQESEILKKEAETTGDKNAAVKAEQLSVEASELEKQAQLSKEKSAVAEQKAKLTQESVEKSNLTIEALNKELTALKKERSLNLGWIPKLSVGGVIISVGFLLLLILNWGLRKFERAITEKDAIREKETTLRLKTISSLFRWTGSIVVFGVVLYMVLDNVGVDMAPILAGAGILGLAVGFGGQYLIRDIINGIFILVEGQYRINDVVKIGDLGGLVEEVNLRYTRLRDLEGRVIYIPNGKVETVINFTQEFAQALLNIGVAYKENVDQVMAVLAQIGADMREDKYYGRLILDNLEMLGVDEFGDSQVTIKCRMKTLPIKQWEVAREFRRRVKNKFDELDIEIPFPHRTIYQGKDKDISKLEEWKRQRKEKEQPAMKRGHAGEIG
jgi:moderate conductance mechanosensitive channel